MKILTKNPLVKNWVYVISICSEAIYFGEPANIKTRCYALIIDTNHQNVLHGSHSRKVLSFYSLDERDAWLKKHSGGL